MSDATTRLVGLAGDRDFLVSRSAGEGMPVVFLNSLAADHRMWGGVRRRLSSQTLAYDARGHGASEVVPGGCTVEDLAGDAFALMDAEGLDRAVLCGLSLGGTTAMRMAAEAPDRVAGLVLANTAVSFPPPSMWEERAEKARGGHYQDLVQPTLERWLTEDFRNANPETAEAVRDMIAATPAEGYATCCEALAQGDESASLRGYEGPVLIVAGEHDQSTPLARAEEMKTLNPNAEIVTLDAAHLSSVEAEADFAAALSEFVRRREAEGV